MQNLKNNKNSITLLSATESKAINGGTNGTDDLMAKLTLVSIKDSVKTVCF